MSEWFWGFFAYLLSTAKKTCLFVFWENPLICFRFYLSFSNLSSALQKGQEWIVEWWPQEGPLSNPQNEVDNPKKRHRKLLRCSGCKQALYCSQNCQKMDWNVSWFFTISMPYLAYSCSRYSVELGFKVGHSNQSIIWVYRA